MAFTVDDINKALETPDIKLDGMEHMQTQLTGSNESNRGATSPDATNVAIRDGEDKKTETDAMKKKKKRKPVEEKKVESVEEIIPQVEYEETAPTVAETDDRLSHALDDIVNIPTAQGEANNSPYYRLGRFNFNIQNRPVSKYWKDDWESLAKEENDANRALSAAGVNAYGRVGAGGKGGTASDRAAEMRRNRIANQYKETWKNIDKGEFDDLATGEFNSDAAFDAVRNNALAYRDAGGDVRELAGHGLNRGGYAARNNADVRKAIMNESIFANARKQLFKDLNTVDKNGRLMYLVNKANYDPIINRIQAASSGTGANMADADKIRVQYLYLPPQRINEYQEVFKNYVNAMANIAARAGKPLPQQKIDNANQAIAAGTKKWGLSSSLQGKAAGFSEIFNSWKMMEGELYQLGVAESTLKNIFDAYVKNIVINAEIDPRILNQNLKMAQEQEGRKATELIRQLGGRRLQTESTFNIPTGTEADGLFRTYDAQYTPNSFAPRMPSTIAVSPLKDDESVSTIY